jgi:predicted AlkP superfamily phosphohydrolase/phosphomutase
MVLGRVDSQTTVMVVSDHGFAPFYRQFNVNTWLLESGYLGLQDRSMQESVIALQGVDWPATRAYSFGLNSIYLNVIGRERDGVVLPEQAGEVAEEICRRLEEVVDPLNGQRVVARAYRADQAYHGPAMAVGPDVVIGYARGYRTSDKSGIGQMPWDIVTDRDDKWSGDHCMDPSAVPGALLTNRQVRKPNPRLLDMAPTILSQFGIEPDGRMRGQPALG